MEYKLELNTEGGSFNIVFHNLIFTTFKINIIERYHDNQNAPRKLLETIIKVRTLDDVLIKGKTGNGRVILRDRKFVDYARLSKALRSYEYRRRLINPKEVEQNYIDFLLLILIANYDINSIL